MSNEEKPAKVKRKKTGRNPNATIPLEKMIALMEKGLTCGQVGRALGITRSAVVNRLKYSGIITSYDSKAVAQYRKVKSDLIQAKGKMLLEAITPEKIEKAGLKDTAIAFGIVNQHGQLEDGKATQNVAMSYANRIREQASEEEEIKLIEAEILSREAGA